ncbi:MAG: amidohydrolase [Firmicutes bacterium]|nr:amidohydrolase [Bacillota bacterium]
MKKNILKRAAALVLALCVVFTFTACGGSDAEPSSYIITNASVYTGEGETAEAVVVKDGVIEYVGDAEGAAEYDDGDIETIDANGGSVLPGMVDGHMHPAMSAVQYYFEIGLQEVFSVEDYVATVKAFVEEHPDNEVYAGSGFMRSMFDSVGPTKEMLDEVCPDKPVILQAADGHSYWVNSKALELAGITKDTEDPANGIIVKDKETGEPTGYLKESAMNLVEDIKPEYTVEQYKEAIAWLQEYFNSLGVTTIYDGMIPITEENYWTAYEEMAEAGELTVKVRGAWHLAPEMGTEEELLALVDQAMEQSEGFTTDYFQVIGFKFFADQVLEEETAYLDEPYTSGNNGMKTWDDDLMETLFTKIDAAGFQIHVHEIGDAAVTYTLDALEKAKATNGTNNRDTFVHCQFIKDEDMKRMADLNVSAMIAPYWAVMDDYYWDLYVPSIGKERADNQYPEESLVKAGVNVGVHSDFSVTEPDWGWLLYSAVTRTLPQKIFDLWYEGMDLTRTTKPSSNYEDYTIGVLPSADERMTLDQIIKAATYGGAYSMNLEDEIGTIEVGKKADLVIMDMDITTSDIEDVSNVQIKKTFSDGRLVFDADAKTEEE